MPEVQIRDMTRRESWTRVVMANSKAGESARMTLVVLAEHADTTGLCSPPIATISRLSGVSERQTQYDLRKLIMLKEIEVVKKGGGRKRPTVYRITVQPIAPFKASERVQSTKGVYAPKKVVPFTLKSVRA